MSGASVKTQLRLSMIKLTIFVVVSVIVTGTLTVIMGSFSLDGRNTFHALFSTASMLKKGDSVRIAGLSVGKVGDVEIYHRDAARVTFSIDRDVTLTTATRASIRYLNLVGNRYLSLSEGEPGARRLRADGTIPESQTEPALNLTALFNGFQPLFQALEPSQVNQLSMNLVRVLQGEGGTIGQVLQHTASLTTALADRDQLIGQVIDNLSSTLQTVDDKHQQLDQVIVQLKQFLSDVARDRNAIGHAVQSTADLTEQLATLLTQARPFVKSDILQIRRLMGILSKPSSKSVLDEVLQRLPTLLTRQFRAGSYGAWYNYYLCDFTGQFILPTIPGVPGLDELNKQLSNMQFHSTAKRCD